MKIFRLSFDLDFPQAQLLQIIQSAGAKAIQTSGGICLKTTGTIEELKGKITPELLKRISFRELNLKNLTNETADVKHFIEQG